MPRYEYECSKCNAHFERDQKITEEPIRECENPECRGPARRLISRRGGFVLNGGGWYRDGY